MSSSFPLEELHFFDAMFSQARLPILLLRLDGTSLIDLKAVYASGPFYERFGYPKLIEKQLGLVTMFRPESYDLQVEELYRALEERRSVTLELKLFTDREEGLWTEVSLSPIALPGGSSSHWCCVLHDLDRLKSLESQLWDTIRESQLHNLTLQRSLDRELLLRRFTQRFGTETRPEALSHGMAEALCEALRADRVAVLFPTAERKRVSLQAQHCQPEIPPLANDAALARGPDLFSHLTEQNQYVLKLDEVSADGIFDLGDLVGSERPARSMLLGALRDEDGRAYGLVCVHSCASRRFGGHEIELLHAVCGELERSLRRARLQQALIQAHARAEAQARELAVALEREQQINVLQADFVSMASHELRTPLAVIDGAVQLLLRPDILERHEQADYVHKQLEKIRRSVTRMGRLVNSSLNLSAVESGQIHFLPAPCNLRQIAEEACQRMQEIHPGIQLDARLNALPEQYFADAGLIDRILTNLLENAVKYSSSDGRVELLAELADGFIHLHVTDHGVGIPKSELGRIFEKFFRASNTTGIVGTGIGLYLARRMAQLHGGELQARSELGKGSVFTLALPLMEA